MSWPGLAPSQMHNPTAYVVVEDVRELRDLVKVHQAELQQWRRRDALAATSLAICAVLGLFRGLRGGLDGCGVQIPIRVWAQVLGVSERMVAKAFVQLELAGLAWHRRRLVKHEWVDGNGIARQRADVHAVAYLSKLGMVRLSRRNEKQRRGLEARAVVKNGRSVRVLFAGGIVGKLLATLATKIRGIALRVTDAAERFTPTAVSETTSPASKQRQRSSPVGSAAGRGSHWPARARRKPGAEPPAAGTKGDRAKLFELWRRGQLTPESAWPDFWKKAHLPYRDRRGHHQERNEKSRRWLIRCAEELAIEFSRAELELLVAGGTIRR